MARGLLDIVEAGYRGSGAESWEAAVIEAASTIDRGLGVFLATIERQPGGYLGCDRMAGSNDLRAPLLRMQNDLLEGNPSIAALHFRARNSGKSMTQLAGIKTDAFLEACRAPPAIRDTLGIMGQVDQTTFVNLYAPSTAPFRVDSRSVHRFRLLGIHLGAGRRLLAHSPTEAVLEPSGKIVHAEGPARESAARDRLRAMATAIDRARTRARRAEPDEALSVWRGLVAGRWSLVDRFESDGRRYTIARKNAPDLGRALALSSTEERVAKLVGSGQSQKYVAYTLGLSTSMVSVHLENTMLKLGLRAKSELVARVGKLVEAQVSTPR